MAPEEKTTSPSPDREQTDESLRAERDKTDRALSELRSAEANADDVVLRARENADAVLNEAREKADQQVGSSASRPASASASDALADARALEDEVRQRERESADESLRRERDEAARVLLKLLPIERDKTDRYLLTERARSDTALANRDDFLGIVSHDLRNLLGAIVMGAELLSQLAPPGDEGKQSLAGTQRIQRYAARMSRLIGDLVDVTSIDAGKLSVTPTHGDARLLISEAVEAFQASASAKNIALEMDNIAQPLLAAFDSDRMLQVLANLITNSIKFTPQGGTIKIRAQLAQGELRFSVQDTGSGVPADKLEKIFQRFWQVGKNDQQGLGLGLYISKCIVEAHGGRIWAESKLAEGSTIHVAIPAA